MINSKIPRRYARALMSLGQEEGQYVEYGQNLQEFSDFCSANDEFFRVVSNQVFALDDRKKIIETVLEKSSFSDMVKNFLRLLLDKDRIGAIKEITDHYSELTDEISNITRAEVVTAVPLKEDAVDRLVQALKALTSKDVKINVSEDATIMGGLIVKAGDLVCNVIPKDSISIIGKAQLPMVNSGKVKKGQEVNIKLISYPYIDYGMVKGKIKSISLVPYESSYSVEIDLVDGLKTFYGKELKLNQGMQGSAEILTDDLRLIQRMVNPIRILLQKNI